MRNVNGLLNQQTTFKKFLSLKEHELSAFHFTSIFLWQDFFDFEFERINESLCVFAHQQGACFQYLPPLANQFDPRVVEAAFKKMNTVNPRTARIENIEQKDSGEYENFYKAYAKSSEYVYDKQDLIELKGQLYKSQRHDIHHFQSHHQGLFRPYEAGDLGGCLNLFERWAKNRHDKHADEIYRAMLEENRKVHELALMHHHVLDLIGYVVEIDQKIAAYSLGYVLNSKTFCVLLEITDPTIVGLSAFIFNRFCKSEYLQQSSLVNTMDDFGLPFVASSKQAYHPKIKPVSYTITQK